MNIFCLGSIVLNRDVEKLTSVHSCTFMQLCNISMHYELPLTNIHLLNKAVEVLKSQYFKISMDTLWIIKFTLPVGLYAGIRDLI